MLWTLVPICVALIQIKTVRSFNLAVNTSYLHTSRGETYFGQSVSVVSLRPEEPFLTRLFAGAPQHSGENQNLRGSLKTCDTVDLVLPSENSSTNVTCHRNDSLHGFEQDVARDGQGSFGMTIAQSRATTKYTVACSPLLQRQCHSVYRAEGGCWIYHSLNLTLKGKREPCHSPCSPSEIDLMFVLDGSFSVKYENFEKVKKWVKQVTSAFDISNAVQVGVVQYSTYYRNQAEQPRMKTEVGLGEFRNIVDFNAAVDKIVYQKYSTFTAHAIYKTVDEDFNGPTSRYPDVRRVMVLVTDGQSTDTEDLPKATMYAKQAGVESFAVGVGNSYVLSELKLIAGSEKRVFTVASFDDLFDIVQRLQLDIQILEGESSTDQNSRLTQCQAGTSASFGKVRKHSKEGVLLAD